MRNTRIARTLVSKPERSESRYGEPAWRIVARRGWAGAKTYHPAPTYRAAQQLRSALIEELAARL